MSTTPSASELVSQAQAATTAEELDQIESQAEGRVTVINAVHDRRDQLAAQQQSSQQQTQTAPQQPATQQVGTQQSAESTYRGGQGLPTVHGDPGGAAPGTENPGDITDPHGVYTDAQVDPPLGPYPDPPVGPYPDPVIKAPEPAPKEPT